MADNKLKELNEISEALFALYPNAVHISLSTDGDKIKVSPKEEYPAGALDEE